LDPIGEWGVTDRPLFVQVGERASSLPRCAHKEQTGMRGNDEELARAADGRALKG
jgi:hypothetical protein